MSSRATAKAELCLARANGLSISGGEKGDPEKLAKEKQDQAAVEKHHDQDGDEKPAPEYRTLKPELDALLRPQVPLPSESQADKDGPEEQRKIILQNLARLRAQWRGQRR